MKKPEYLENKFFTSNSDNNKFSLASYFFYVAFDSRLNLIQPPLPTRMLLPVTHTLFSFHGYSHVYLTKGTSHQ